MTTEGILALVLGLVIGGISVPLIIRAVRVVGEARRIVGQAKQLSGEHEAMRIVLATVLAQVSDAHGRYRITKSKREKAKEIETFSWHETKDGHLVIETKGEKP